MLLSGFTFIRNARKYDFPILECIESMLPIVDELIVCVGDSEDDTEALIAGIKSDKIKIVRSVWDDSKTDRGLVLSEQTNIALKACSGKWCLYLQADEAIHESEHEAIRRAVERASDDVDGFRFKYLHFYGGYSLVQRPWNWYPSEIRLIRKDSGAYSYGDAQTFRKADDAELNAPLIDAHVFHYGHARDPEVMQKKIRYFHRFWHGDAHGIEVKQAYQLEMKNLVWYWGSHPRSYLFRVNAGKGWSPKPSTLVRHSSSSIVIFGCENEAPLAEELRDLLLKHTEAEVEIVIGLRAWLSRMMGMALKPRGLVQLIDLHAEDRNILVFLSWMLDMLLFFRRRIAHAPNGRLSRFRARFYTAINWGAHETTARGFHVPEKEHARQLARWSGVDL